MKQSVGLDQLYTFDDKSGEMSRCLFFQFSSNKAETFIYTHRACLSGLNALKITSIHNILGEL